MSNGVTTRVVTGELHRVRHGRGVGFSAEPPPEPSIRPARIATTLALAHMIRRAIDRGEIRDQADAARTLGVTRARMTQLIDLTFLAPDLQDVLLRSLSPSSLTERTVRLATRCQSWIDQRELVLHPNTVLAGCNSDDA